MGESVVYAFVKEGASIAVVDRNIDGATDQYSCKRSYFE